MSIDYNQWSSTGYFWNLEKPSWVPEEDQERLAAYTKYDQVYWNDPRQFSLRVLEGETPLYIPNARIIVDTTAHFIMKGLDIVADGTPLLKTTLDNFLKREIFYSRFHTAKHSGVARGDYFLHLTANPAKTENSRVSLNSVDPSKVFPIYDDNEPDKLIGCHIAEQYYLPGDPEKVRVRKLTYRLEEKNGKRRVSREEGIYEMDPLWYGKKPKLVQQRIPFGYLDERITAIPIYAFKNMSWDGEQFGSSELRGFESMLQTVSQGSTDISGALSLEGLGVYATDGGRPVDDDGVEINWEVAPGRVMEVPSGSYFRRVEGVGSITPAKDQIVYLEDKMMQSASLSDVALGKVEAQVAQSGIALAIRFLPTFAKVEQRDNEGLGKLTQLFYDWQVWQEVFEFQKLEGLILPTLGDKLPLDRTGRINELNNMLDRRVISTNYYRDEMTKLGYEFPSGIEGEILRDLERVAPQEKKEEEDPSEEDREGISDADGKLVKENTSNNKARPNESAGTEADSGSDK